MYITELSLKSIFQSFKRKLRNAIEVTSSGEDTDTTSACTDYCDTDLADEYFAAAVWPFSRICHTLATFENNIGDASNRIRFQLKYYIQATARQNQQNDLCA